MQSSSGGGRAYSVLGIGRSSRVGGHMPGHASKLYVAIRCSSTRADLVATFIRHGEWWMLTSTMTPPSGQAPPTGSLGAAGNFGIADEYRGCDRCRANSYVL